MRAANPAQSTLVQRHGKVPESDRPVNSLSHGITVKSKYSISLPRNIRVRLERVTPGRRRKPSSPRTPPSPNQDVAVNPRTGKVALGPWTGPYAVGPASPPSPTLYADMDGHSYTSVQGDRYLTTKEGKTNQLNSADTAAVTRELMSEIDRQLQRKTAGHWSQPKHTGYTKAQLNSKPKLHQINQPRKMY